MTEPDDLQACFDRQDELRDAQEKMLIQIIDRELDHLRDLRAADVAAVKAALDAADKAVSKAEDAAARRFDSVNEFRQTLSDQTQTFISKAEVRIMIDALHAADERIRTETKIMVDALHEKVDRAVTTQRATFITLLALALSTGISVTLAIVNRAAIG